MASQSSSGFQRTWSGAASKFGTWTFGISTKVQTASLTFSSTQNTGTKETQLTRTPSWLLLSVFQVPNFVNILEFFKSHFINFSVSSFLGQSAKTTPLLPRKHDARRKIWRRRGPNSGRNNYWSSSSSFFQTMVATSGRDDRTSEDIVKIVINKGSIQRVRHWFFKPHFSCKISVRFAKM